MAAKGKGKKKSAGKSNSSSSNKNTPAQVTEQKPAEQKPEASASDTNNMRPAAGKLPRIFVQVPSYREYYQRYV